MRKELTITTSVVSANRKGLVALPKDPRKSDVETGHVVITLPSHPDLHAELDIPLGYDYKFTSNFTGSTGLSGMNGTDGLEDTSGSMGSMDPNNPSAGGDGSDGGNGSDGKDRGPGGDAPPVQIRVMVRAGSHALLQIGVTATGKQKLYLVDPFGGPLAVSADGGPAGSGGKGGRGGRGGSGSVGSRSGNSGRDGSSGRSGSDGSSGRGGSITLTYDPQAKPYLSVIDLSNQGGPAPVFREEPVASVVVSGIW